MASLAEVGTKTAVLPLICSCSLSAVFNWSRVVPIPIENLGRVVRRPIVEDDQLPVGEHLRSNALQSIREESAVVVAEDVDAHGRGGLECQDTLLDSLQDANDARVESHARLLYDQAVIAEGSRVKDPVALARRINELLVRDAGA